MFSSPFQDSNSLDKLNFHIGKKYVGGTITLPAKKYFNGIQYDKMSSIQQGELLLDLVKVNAPLFYSFEEHPNRNKKTSCMHMHLLYEYETQSNMGVFTLDSWLENQDYKANLLDNHYENLIKLTKSNMIRKICKFEWLEQEYNVINWINYMYKTYSDHYYLLTYSNECLIRQWFAHSSLGLKTRKLALPPQPPQYVIDLENK